jgi:hypothetical protein
VYAHPYVIGAVEVTQPYLNGAIEKAAPLIQTIREKTPVETWIVGTKDVSKPLVSDNPDSLSPRRLKEMPPSVRMSWPLRMRSKK